MSSLIYLASFPNDITNIFTLSRRFSIGWNVSFMFKYFAIAFRMPRTSFKYLISRCHDPLSLLFLSGVLEKSLRSSLRMYKRCSRLFGR